MKKIIELFNKKRRLSVISNEIASDAVPEAPSNIPRYVIKPSEFYNNFQIDLYSNSKNIFESQPISHNSRSEVAEETSNISGCIENISNTHVEELTESDLPVARGSEHSSPDIESNPQQTGNTTSERPELNKSNNSDLTSLVRSDNSTPLSNLTLEELPTTDKSAHEIEGKKDLEREKKKSSGNTYMITISNSAHFHIGSQKTVNYYGQEDNFKKEFKLNEDKDNLKLLPMNVNELLDMKDKLSEDDILQISLNVRDKWRDFARNLGVTEATIREIEDLNNHDYTLIVYDILQQYLSRYPHTTIGYIINVLKKSNEYGAIQKLTEKR